MWISVDFVDSSGLWIIAGEKAPTCHPDIHNFFFFFYPKSYKQRTLWICGKDILDA